jgi:uncharacterized protein
MYKINKLEVIFKVTEVCNIDCTYCYFFDEKNPDFKSKPAHASMETVEEIAQFLRRTCLEHEIEHLQVDLHGGEPLMLGKRKFKDMLNILHRTLDDVVDLVLVLQTNAMLLDSEWIELLGEGGVHASISLDGPKSINDRERLDKKGLGTYDATVAGLRLLQEGQKTYPNLMGGVICVARQGADGGAVYRHFVNDLGLKRVHILLPDTGRDSTDLSSLEFYTDFVVSAAEEWLRDGPKGIHVRLFRTMLAGVLGRARPLDDGYVYRTVTIRSDGALDPDDDLRNGIPSLFGLGYTVREHTYAEFIADPRIAKLFIDTNKPSAKCADCDFYRACQSGVPFGQPEHRYSFFGGFNNASIFCSAYKKALTRIVDWCLASGVSEDLVSRSLAIDRSRVRALRMPKAVEAPAHA